MSSSTGAEGSDPPAPEGSLETGVRIDKLAVVLAEFAERLVQGFRVQEILDHLVQRIVDVLPITGAGVMLMGPASELHFAAASNETILQMETLQNELGEGPCLEAYRTGEPVGIADLARDSRFPHFCERASDAGLAAVFTFPMSINGRRFGALDLYRDQAGGLEGPAMEAAQVLANVAAAYLHYAHDRAETADVLDLMRQRSLHDPLTGLPNRTLLRERLEQAVARTTRSGRLVAVLFIDLDRFKAVNDDHGHHVGDQVLIAVGDRIAKILRSGETVARLAGDEFVVVCEDLARPEQAQRIADKVAHTLAVPFVVEGITLPLTASIGVAYCGPGEALPETLIRDADLAMYQAKEAGGGRHRLVDPAQEIRGVAEHRVVLTQDLRRALADHDLRLAYQPIVATSSKVLDGVEALLRWRHPRLGWVPPESVVRVAEASGLILPLGEWVLEQACRDLRRWQRTYRAAPSFVTVNVSALQLMTPGFDETVEQVLRSTGVDPASLFLEVTETVFLENGPRALSALKRVSSLGVGITLDDFGTGYSSLNYLRRFPFDIVKVDRVFAQNVHTDPSTRTIVAAVIDLAHGLGLSVVAEGVETPEQLAELERLGADRVQGFYLGRPQLRDDFDRSLSKAMSGGPLHLPVRVSADYG